MQDLQTTAAGIIFLSFNVHVQKKKFRTPDFSTFFDFSDRFCPRLRCRFLYTVSCLFPFFFELSRKVFPTP
jgi:hypothetical protein